MTTTNTTIAVQCEWIKIIPNFFVRLAKIFFLVYCRILAISLYMPWDEKVETTLDCGTITACKGGANLHSSTQSSYVVLKG